MGAEKKIKKPATGGQVDPLVIFKCGPKKSCPDGTEHDFSKFVKLKNGGTTVCSKCGHRAIDDAMWY